MYSQTPLPRSWSRLASEMPAVFEAPLGYGHYLTDPSLYQRSLMLVPKLGYHRRSTGLSCLDSLTHTSLCAADDTPA